MTNIQILDCTLRDGGYVNNWNFGKKVIKKILSGVTEAGINIVECGFLSEIEYDENKALYNNTSQIKSLLPGEGKSKYVAMIALGEKEIAFEKVQKCDGESIFGIRLTFHKHEIERAFQYAQNLMDKGYQVFVQPVGTCSYSDMELLELVEKVNKLNPYAFYIVDTLGTITGSELMRLFQMVDNNLKTGIKIGFHSHNNLQLSFANAQELIRLFTKREIIIDASLFGMGRGAGNLCTELLAQYMNENVGTTYNVTSLLEIVDNHLMSIKEENPWGYTIPYYIAAVNKCHPNYATFLINRQTIAVKDIEKIIASIPSEERAVFNKKQITELYNAYLTRQIDDSEAVKELHEVWKNKDILVLAPGKTLVDEKEKIEAYINKNKPYIISVNFCGSIYHEDMIFISNMKRFENLDFVCDESFKEAVVITSNIDVPTPETVIRVNYANYLNDDHMISDNAGIMLCNLLKKCGVTKIALAGFDGFSSEGARNYFDKELINNVEADMLEIKTQKIGECLRRLKEDIEISFITKSMYERM